MVYGWAEFSYISILIMGLGAMPYLVSMKSRLMLQCGVAAGAVYQPMIMTIIFNDFLHNAVGMNERPAYH